MNSCNDALTKKVTMRNIKGNKLRACFTQVTSRLKINVNHPINLENVQLYINKLNMSSLTYDSNRMKHWHVSCYLNWCCVFLFQLHAACCSLYFASVFINNCLHNNFNAETHLNYKLNSIKFSSIYSVFRIIYCCYNDFFLSSRFARFIALNSISS